MLEVTFNDSLAGSLIMCSGDDDRIGKVLSLDYMYLQLGDLTEGVFSDHRLCQIQSFFQNWLLADLAKYTFSPVELRKEKKKVNKVLRAAENGEPIRFWYSLQAGEYCPFLYLMSLLSESEAGLSCICLQNDLVSPPEGIFYWGQMEPEMVPSFFAAERKLSVESRARYAAEWKRLTSEPWPLRTMSEGFIVGVPETYFDGGISSFIPERGDFRPIKVLENYYCAVPTRLDYFATLWRISTILKQGDYALVRMQKKDPNWQYMADIDRAVFRRGKREDGKPIIF